ncbi:hypothetical protein BDD12DRAFT_858610 [Trichophaea hybrida]|nr:hypothetical protein BDD12DRAFT_858610 [Trichophaea hybrida]
MNSANHRTKPVVFRVQNIPTCIRKHELEIIIAKFFMGTEKDIKIRLDMSPSCQGDDTQTALLEFSPRYPTFLDEVVNGKKGAVTKEVDDDTDISIDKNFYGLTQLYETTLGEKIQADIVAVSGLDGHAYGSWKARDNRKMWLRHFLGQHFRNCRTMIYGYNSKLQSRSIQQISDYNREFLGELQKARRTEDELQRPLIFIAHGFGGVIVPQTLVRALERDHDLFARSMFEKTHAVMFFGTPHRGMLMSDILDMLEPDSREKNQLIRSIDQNSDYLGRELERFINCDKRPKVVSFYEQQQTRRLVKNEDGTYSRSGDFVIALEKNATLLHLPDREEEKHPVDADHSNIVKFDNMSDRTYQHVRIYLEGYLKELEIGICSGSEEREIPGKSLVTVRQQALGVRPSPQSSRSSSPEIHLFSETPVVIPQSPGIRNGGQQRGPTTDELTSYKVPPVTQVQGRRRDDQSSVKLSPHSCPSTPKTRSIAESSGYSSSFEKQTDNTVPPQPLAISGGGQGGGSRPPHESITVDCSSATRDSRRHKHSTVRSWFRPKARDIAEPSVGPPKPLPINNGDIVVTHNSGVEKKPPSNKLEEQQQYKELLKIYKSTLDQCRTEYGRKDVRTIDAAEAVARVMVNLEWVKEGLDWHRDILEARKEVLGNRHPDTLQTVEEIACLLDLMGMNQEAERWRQEAR